MHFHQQGPIHFPWYASYVNRNLTIVLLYTEKFIKIIRAVCENKLQKTKKKCY